MNVMVTVPGGQFEQGSPAWVLDWLMEQDQPLPRIWFGDETPTTVRVVRPFRMDRFPVTNAQFHDFVRATGFRSDAEQRGIGMVYTDVGWQEREGVSWREPGGPGTSILGYEDHPVVHMSFLDAEAYADWAGKRLPTESEWEFAARGPEFRIWPWGDRWDEHLANTAELHAGKLQSLEQWQEWWRAMYAKDGPVPRTTPVGDLPRRSRSMFGCADMAGNVYEWTSTVSRLYGPESVCDPTVRQTLGRYRVIRGGSWMNFRYQVRCSERMHGDPLGWSSFAHGFRCAQDA
jgi:sulfatase modifying factor 1